MTRFAPVVGALVIFLIQPETAGRRMLVSYFLFYLSSYL